MNVVGRLVAVVPVPATVEGPLEPGVPGRRLVIARSDTALAVYDLEDGVPVVTFPAPWPRNAGGVDAVSPGLDVAVFSGMHAVRAVTPDGRSRWEIRHSCWACGALHDDEHRYSDHGSVGFSADGRTLWAHVRPPVDDDAADDPRGEISPEAWWVIDAATGAVLGEADTETAAAGSHHIPHPDPTVMGLSVGEGQDGSPALWGRWHEGELLIDRLDGDDRVLVAVGPGGRTFLTIGHERRQELTLHDTVTQEVLGTFFADALPDNDARARWDFRLGLVDGRTLVASTSHNGHGAKDIRHWLIDVEALEARGPVRYPDDVPSGPIGLGDGTWMTLDRDRHTVSVWQPGG